MRDRKKRSVWRILRWTLLSLVLLLLLVAGAVIAFPGPVARWALRQLGPYGLEATIKEADLLSGTLRVEKLRWLQQRKHKQLSIRAETGEIQLRLWALVLGVRWLPSIRLESPVIQIRRWRGERGPKTRVVESKSKRQTWAANRQKMKLLLKGRSGSILRVGELHIKHGRLSWYDRGEQGVSTRVEIRDVESAVESLDGRLILKNILVERRQPGLRLTMKVPRGSMRLDLQRLVASDVPSITSVTIDKPDLRLERMPGSSTKAKGKRKTARRLQGLQAIQIGLLRIRRGRLALYDRRPGHRSALTIREIDGRFKDWRGAVSLKKMRSQSRGARRLELSLVRGRATLDLRTLLVPPLVLKDLVLEQPKAWVNFQPRSRARRKKKKRQSRWIKVEHLVIKKGAVRLRFLPRRVGEGTISLSLRQTKMDVRGLDLRYLLARPWRGKGSVLLQSSEKVSFSAAPEGSSNHRFSLSQLPVSAFNTALEAKGQSLRLAKGRLSVKLLFLHKSPEQVEVQSVFDLRDLKVRLLTQGFDLKQLFLRTLLARLNKYFENLPQGYRLRASFVMSDRELALRPSMLFRRLGVSLRTALLDAFFKKHPKLRRFRGLVERKMARSQSEAYGAAQPSLRETIKTRVGERREHRKERRKARRERRKLRWKSWRKRW